MAKYTGNTPITLQTGIREYNGDLSQYTGMLGGLTPDIHTLRSLNPLTTNRVICVMYRGPYFMQQYFKVDNNEYNGVSAFMTYKKVLEYYNQGIQVNMGDGQLGPATLQGGFAGRTISIPTTQNTQQNQTLTITVSELCGRPISTFHNMWVDGIADPITGLCTYHGLVAGSEVNGINQRIFSSATGANETALEPNPAWEVAEFLIIALDRTGARPEGAVMALGCTPANKVGQDIFTHVPTGNSEIQKLTLTFNCQFVQSTYVNDLAARYVRQFAVFGNSLNFNPGAGDAFFVDKNKSTTIDTEMFNGGVRPNLDAVQSGLGNAPVFSADPQPVERKAPEKRVITPADHSQIYNSEDPNDTTPINGPYSFANGNRRNNQ